MTQKELNLVFELTIMVHTHPFLKKLGREELQEWVRDQLAENGIYSIPVGMSWGSLVDKERYEKYKEELNKK